MNLAYLARGAASAERARARMLRSGYTVWGQKLWSEEEDLICRLFHPDYFALRQILCNRTDRAIQARCRKLGLVRPRQSWEWLARQKLRKLYPEATYDELCAAFPDRDLQNIQAAARYYGFKRKKKPYKKTGVPALDAVRSRCYDVKINMRELDEDCRTKKYFQKRGCRTQYPNFRAINRAASYLGGYLDFHFPPET
ncbi:hypothetical protein HFO94_27615 [Rhizobium leguminosarum]|uniref:hypothetical protein n=1 Tax=Rhizobium leguminosarum TaxID=384 RepID=UPI001C93857A|nr:hypothetical protein [Rhizobium leguminosarum]MBY5357250.1 hypothetical protein [Rhizobium leguminosarum]